jgi:hypothetical protein
MPIPLDTRLVQGRTGTIPHLRSYWTQLTARYNHLTEPSSENASFLPQDGNAVRSILLPRDMMCYVHTALQTRFGIAKSHREKTYDTDFTTRIHAVIKTSSSLIRVIKTQDLVEALWPGDQADASGKEYILALRGEHAAAVLDAFQLVCGALN